MTATAKTPEEVKKSLLVQVLDFVNLFVSYADKNGNGYNLEPLTKKIYQSTKDEKIKYSDFESLFADKANIVLADFELVKEVTDPKKILANKLAGKDEITLADIIYIEMFLERAKLLAPQPKQPAKPKAEKSTYQELIQNLDSNINNWTKNNTFPQALELLKLVKERTKQLKGKYDLTNDEIEVLKKIKEEIKNGKENTNTYGLTIESITEKLIAVRPALVFPEPKQPEQAEETK